jgi:Protein of unknown function (DUF721).
MKEIKKLSDLLDTYISILTQRMRSRKKDVNIYNQWEIIAEKENLSFDSYLDDFKNNTLFIHVNHPGNAQQIRMKSKKIINEFNGVFPNLNVKKINISVDTVFDINQNVPCGTFGKDI